MIDTTARLLALLSALQANPVLSGTALAVRLGVTTRTVRRDVDRLRQLGYVVDADRGVSGGYRLGRGGAAVPPLLLDEDEIVALAVCVRAAAGDSVAGIADAASRSLSKLEQALPGVARSKIQSIVASTLRLAASGDEVDGTILLTLTTACRDHQQVRVDYSDVHGRQTERRLEPHRVVSVGRRWYLVALDVGARDWRTFRVDRIGAARTTGHGTSFVDPPDAVEFVQRAITTAPYRHQARVELHAPLAEIARRVPPSVGMLESTDRDTTVLTTGADDLDLLVVHLGLLGVAFEVLEPPELRERVAVVAARLAAGGRPG
jgi:predicted DNA-binding transcriptional regulator YafY